MNNLKRLHIASIFVIFAEGLKNLIIPLLVSLFLGGSREPIGFFRFEYIWIAILFLIIISGFIKWLTFRYTVENGELYIEQGLFVKKKRYIQPNRIQSIDITAGVIQRLFGLVKLKIETAGGGLEPEVDLIAIHKEEAYSIRTILLKQMNDTPNLSNETEEEESKEKGLQRRLTINRLLIAALTSNGIGIVISAVVAFVSQIEQFLPETVYDRLFSFLTTTGYMVIVFVVLFILLVAWVVSIMMTMLKYGRFEITKKKDELIISRGLLEQRQLTLQMKRITSIRIVRGILRQPFGFSTIYVESAGGGSKDEQLSTILLPIIKNHELEQFFRDFLPDYQYDLHFKRIPRRALRRSFLRLGFIPFIITLILAIFITPFGYYGFIIVFIFLIIGFLQYRDAGFNFTEKQLFIRFRKISQTIVLTKKKHIQSAEVSKSYFQRRKSLSSFHFSILTSIAGKRFSLIDTDGTDANDILDWYRKKEEK